MDEHPPDVDGQSPGRGVAGWDARHAANQDPGEPHPAVVDAVAPLQPGEALDVACGTGRHSLWLAGLGWQVTGLDSSGEGLRRARIAAQERGLEVKWVLADALDHDPAPESYDLVLMSYVRLPEVFARAAAWLRPGGRLVLVGPAVRNLTDGTGGPRDPALLHDHVDLAARATGARLRVLRAAEVTREGPDGTVLEAVLVAERRVPSS